MFLVIAMLSVSFIGLGRKMQTLRGQLSPGARVEPLYWGLGVMLNVHIVNWFGITYWDQSNAVWFLHLAMIGSLAFADPAVHGASPRLQVIR